jgi:hypothetical protein
MPIIKAAQRHKCNTKTAQIHENEILNGQKKMAAVRKQQYKLNTRTKTLNTENLG